MSMSQAMPSYEVPEERTDSGKHAIGIRMLAACFALMMSGGLPTVSIFSRAALWGLLSTMWLLIFWIGRDLPLKRILYPIAPFLAWLVCYYLWGMFVSPVAIMQVGLKIVFFSSLVICTVIVAMSNAYYWRIFATYVQWAMVMNLALMLFLTTYPQYVDLFTDPVLNVDGSRLVSSDRFAGLWGNANQAGFAALTLLILSVWAKPLVAWIGRVCGVTIIFLTASRQSTWLFILVLLLLAVMVLGRKTAWKVGILVGGLLVMLTIPFLDANLLRQVSDNPKIARILDFTESSSKSATSDSRVEVLQAWMPAIIHGPWYGHGLAASAGSDNLMTELRHDVPYMGIHNLYLGIWADVGLLGLLTFLVLVGRQAVKTFFVQSTPLVKWGIISFALVVLIDSFVKHTMFFEMNGMAAYTMMFLFPGSPAARMGED